MYFKTRWDVEIFKDQGLMEFIPYCASQQDLDKSASIEDMGAGLAIFDGRSHARFLGLDHKTKGKHIPEFCKRYNFIFDKAAYVAMYEQDFLYTLDRVLRCTDRASSAPSSHDIWTLMFPRYVRKICNTR